MILQIPEAANLASVADLAADRAIIWTVYVPLIIWIVLIVLFLWILVSRFPLRSVSGHANPYETETMAIPRGVIRGILALSVLVAVILFQVYALRFLESSEEISAFINAFQVVLGFYFGAKVVHHLASADKNKVKAVARSRSETSGSDFNDPSAVG
jgi:uncharacterized membrane protein